MAIVLNRTTKKLLFSVDTPEYDNADWVINPDLSAVANINKLYWKINNDVVTEMNKAEKDAADIINLPIFKDKRKISIDRNTISLVEDNENANGSISKSKAYIDDGRVLKTAIDGAADKAALDAMPDNRTG